MICRISSAYGRALGQSKEALPMIIAKSNVSMAASGTLAESTAKQSHLEYWVGDRNRSTPTVRNAQDAQDQARISALAKKLASSAAAAQTQQAGADEGSGDSLDGLPDRDKQRIQLMEQFLYRLTGKHFNFSYLKMYSAQGGGSASDANQAQAAAQPQKAGYGVIYDSTQTNSEQQTMDFQASGSVRTADGRSIDINVALKMSRQFQSSVEEHLRAGDAKVDPLVINLSGQAPQLSPQKDFKFDIDADGDEDQVSRLLSGSGFLALDKNGDGTINNGSELFGPTSGNGFAELKAYDADGNGWIDENDPVYNKLRIWEDDGQGNMQLLALGQAGVGALYLGNVASGFDINDSQNNSLGSVQSTGIYLNEDGSAGTVQHIDFTL
jgi:hypothetical protein